MPYVYDLAGVAVPQEQYEREVREHFERYPLPAYPLKPMEPIASGARPTEGPWANKGRQVE